MVSQNEITVTFKILAIFQTASLLSRVQIKTALICALENGLADRNISRI